MWAAVCGIIIQLTAREREGLAAPPLLPPPITCSIVWMTAMSVTEGSVGRSVGEGRAGPQHYLPTFNSISTDLVACKLLCVNTYIINEVTECNR